MAPSSSGPAQDVEAARPAAPWAPEPASCRWVVYGLLALSLVLLAYPMLRIGFDFEIDNNEGWNAYHQMRALVGQSLYVTGSPYFFNNYPPLSFYLVGAAASLVGDPVIAGRLVSILSLVAIAMGAAGVVRAAGAARLDAVFAFATCIALFASFATDYVGMNDPQLLGMAFITCGLAVYLRAPASVARGIGVAVLLGLGLLTKHNMIVVPLLLAVDAWRRWPPRPRLAFFAAGITLATASAGFLWLTEGKAFFDALLAGRIYDPARAFLLTIDMLGRLQAPLAAVGLVLLLARKQRPMGLVGAYLGLALVQGAVLSGGANTDINLFFDVFVALAIGAGLAVHWLGRTVRAPAAWVGLALTIHAGVLFYAPQALGRFVVDIAGEMAERERLFHADVAYLRAIPGRTLCQSFLLCFRAGKPMFYDPHNASMAIARGRLPADLLTGMLGRHEIAVLQIADRREHRPDDYPGVQAMPAFFIHFSDREFDVLEREYKVGRVGISGRFFVPRAAP